MGGGGGKSQTQTVYYANFDFLLGFSPLQRILAVWGDRNPFGVGQYQQTFSFTGTTFSSTISNNPGTILGVTAISVVMPYSVTFADYAGPVGGAQSGAASGNITQWLYNNPTTGKFWAPGGNANFATTGWPWARFVTQSQTAGGAFTVNVPVSGTYSITVYYAYYLTNQANNIPLSSSNPGSWQWNLSFEKQLGNGNEYTFPGGTAQQIIYPEMGGVGGTVYLGSSNTLPQFSFETDGLYGYTSTGDCNPADIILDILQSGPSSDQIISAVTGGVWNHGLGLPASFVSDPFGYAPPANPSYPSGAATRGLMAIRTYCEAYGIFVSGSMEAQQSAKDWLNQLGQVANCVYVWNGSQLVVIPRCEVSIAGPFGVYFSPTASGPVLNITDSLALGSSSQVPITVARNRKADAFNVMPFDHVNRIPGSDPAYNTVSTPVQDMADIYVNGPILGSSVNLPWANDANTATLIGMPIIKESTMVDRKKFTFSLPGVFSLLDPWDLVTLNDTVMGLSSLPVRLTRVVDTGDQADFEAEPYIYGAYAPTTRPVITGNPGGNNTNADPGVINTPLIFEPVARLAGFPNQNQIWFAVSGASANYGGADVYMSTDGGSSYQFMQRMVGSSSLGLVYNSTFPVGTDPDATNSLFLDLSQSAGETTLPTSFSTAQRDAFIPLILVAPGGTITIGTQTYTIPYEIVSYATATLASAGKYQVNPTTRRGGFNTPIAAHAVAQQAVYLGPGEGTVGRINIDPSLIGKTLWFKFTPFNTYFANEAPIASATAYSFVPSGLTGVGSQSQNSYTIVPAAPLYQGKAGGWSGIDANSSTWTDPTKIYFPAVTATWTNPFQAASYVPRDSGVAAFTNSAGGQVAYVSIYDPARTGETSATLTVSVDIGSNQHNAPGYVFLGTLTSVQYASGGGGGSGTGGGSGSGGGSQPTSGPYVQTVYCPTTMGAYYSGVPSHEFLRIKVANQLVFAANCGGSFGDARMPAAASTTFTLKQNGATVGTVIYAAAGTVPSFSTTAVNGFTLNPGDEFIIVGPAIADAALEGFGFVILATRY